MWCASVTSMITECGSDYRSDRNVLERGSRFILGLNASKNTDYIKKCSKQKLFRSNFATKNLAGANLYLHQEWS